MMATNSYQCTKVIGRGQFGVVYRGYHKQTKREVAIKVLELDTKHNEVVDVQQEVQFLASLKNAPNVTHYHGSFLNDTKLWIIMDHCAGGSLRTLLKPGVFEERFIGVVAREVLLALLFVHKQGLIHRDLKAANILVTKEGQVQLCDFGVATQLSTAAHKRTTMAGTSFWMAPEVIREGAHYNSKADIWSLGITLYELATGNPPYSDKGGAWAMAMIEKLTPPRLEGRDYPAALKDCIALCLDENPEERLSADELQKCRLVKQYKNVPTSIMKELVTRYLVWREKSQRESVFYGVDDDIESIKSDTELKWDFDTLSSKEYIVQNNMLYGDDNNMFTYPREDNYTMSADYTLNRDSLTISDGRMLLTHDHIDTIHPDDLSLQGQLRASMKSESVPPRSLASLFEEESSPSLGPLYSGFPVPKIPQLIQTASPTIEIPDMESLSKIGSVQSGAGSVKATPVQSASMQSLNPHPTNSTFHYGSENFPKSQAQLSMSYQPPMVSAASDSRISSPSGRGRKKTISNSYGTANSSIHPLDPLSPQTPLYISDSRQKDSSSPLLTNHSIPDPSVNFSPSKSMRALQSSNNPMLQPINFKLNDDTKNSSKSLSQNNTISTTHLSNSVNGSATVSASSTGNNGTTASSNHVNGIVEKRDKPSLRIQMPVPSNSFNLLSALTNDENITRRTSESNINQFGINPSLISNVTSMTPVTEKEIPFEDGKDKPSDLNVAIQSRNIQKRALLAQSNGLKSAPVLPSGPTMNGGTGQSSNSSSMVNPISRPTSNKKSAKFPSIPILSPEILSDSTSKEELGHELYQMLGLLNQGLDVVDHLL